jgi:hypothetical protein
VSRLFGAYVIVDWSSASKPAAGAEAIAIGVLKRDVRFRLTYEGFTCATRAEAEKQLGLVFDDLKKRNEKALLGLPFPLGFPRGFAAALKLSGEPWQAAIDQVDKMTKDKPDNVNNRFAVGSEINRRMTGGPFPFWGCPPRDALTTLQPKRGREHGEGDVPEFRYADLALPAAKGGPTPIWKLYYAGQLGGLTILGLPMLKRLKKARALKIWPFETGWKPLAPADLAGVDILAAEIRLGAHKSQPSAVAGRDHTEVRGLAEHFAKLDETGKLSAAFAAPKSALPEQVEAVEREEGWVLTGA